MPHMYFVALATDYDGTLAHDGRVNAATIEALKEVKRSGRKLILVTGRDLPDLQRVFPEVDLCDLVVAENGALLFNPAKKEEVLLAEPPSPAFVARLRELGVTPLAMGRTIVATWEPNETAVLRAIRWSREQGVPFLGPFDGQSQVGVLAGGTPHPVVHAFVEVARRRARYREQWRRRRRPQK